MTKLDDQTYWIWSKSQRRAIVMMATSCAEGIPLSSREYDCQIERVVAGSEAHADLSISGRSKMDEDGLSTVP